MSDEVSKEQFVLEVARLKLQIGQLTQRVETLQREKADLESLLTRAITHSDATIESLRQDKVSLEGLLETTTQHSEAVEAAFNAQTDDILRQSEEQFRLIAEATPLPVLISNVLDGTILYANAITTTTFGLALTDLIGRKTSDFYWNPEDRQQILAIFAQQGYVQNYELQLKRQDSSLLWVVLSLRPFMFNGELTFLSALCDISDRKQMEDSLRIAEATYRGIFENAIEGIFQSTFEGRYLKVNPSMARIYGYRSAEEMMVQVTDIAKQIYVDPSCRQIFLEQIEAQGEVVDFEYQVYRCDGRVIWVSESSRAIRNSVGQLLYYEGTNVDITRRKQQEEWLRQQLELLQFDIDFTEVEAQVAEITETDFFQQLRQAVRGSI
ncbi:PAS domain S-box protein [Oscillatoria sp. FACHB-1407]|uniref:PAS domain-containing protein n=1 Tax=Oscillatoria sp. FACHB-1407 TaxID=2692847 RepID=UPI001688E317|nr:PAS domain-containing protein [Oscillatoria sp. FACHB-1407]MBD2461070.1 PAS domain S-box protein [Oscillatoria sp. FACHB-1407]